LTYAIRGFFENGGSLCYAQVISYDDGIGFEKALQEGLKTLETFESIDLICLPDIMFPRENDNIPLSRDSIMNLQAEILNHCDRCNNRFAILDSFSGADPEVVKSQAIALPSPNGALYYPWVRPADTGFIPPCGHVAGVYARSDRQIGIHKAPANEILEGVLDLEVNVSDNQQKQLNPFGVNCIRSFPGRGIRIWGARTLAAQNDSEWTYLNVRRLFLMVGRWFEQNMAGVVFEPIMPSLWERIKREATGYLNDLFLKGALQGRTPQEAFYVKCDAEINPPGVREAGLVISDIGLAPAVPGEFIVIRIHHDSSGIAISQPPKAPVE
jgi:phage tail sheath protein FI